MSGDDESGGAGVSRLTRLGGLALAVIVFASTALSPAIPELGYILAVGVAFAALGAPRVGGEVIRGWLESRSEQTDGGDESDDQTDSAAPPSAPQAPSQGGDD